LDQALKVERERAAAAAALAETAFEATKRKITEEREREAARVRSLEEQLRSDREAVAAEVAARAVVEEQLAARMRVGEEAQRVEQQKISAALASATSDLETLRRELVGVRERETARASSLDAQLQSERAAHAAAVAALAVGRGEQERAATELAAASAAFELRNQALLDERDQATRSLTLEHEAHERSLIEEHEANRRSLIEEHEANRRSLIEEHDANKRSLTLEHERERAPLQTRVEQLEAECVARAAEQQRLVAEVDAQRTRLVSDAEAERSDRALALARANEELKSQSERAREAFEAEQKRATGALAAAMADFAAQQFALVEERERASARATSLEEQLMSARADHAAVVAAASQDDGEPLRRAEAALAEEQARSEALAIALRTAREGEQDLAEEQRRLRREYDAERRASEATLARASRDAQVAVRESAAGFAAEKARAEALSKELEQERASRDERIDQSARDGAAERERHEATLEQAIREARETVQRVQAHGEEQTAQAAGNAARLERVIAERDASLAADRDESNRRWLLLQTEHARTIERLLAADVESRAQQSAEHELALDELRCELNDQHRVAAEARAQELARFGSAHDAVVARLEAELTVAREALAAERRSRSAPAGRPRTQPERIRSDAEYRIVSEEPRVSAVPSTRPAVVRPSGEVAIPRDPHDPREILRNVLLRSLAEDQAELAITMALGAAGRRELPAQRDELLALIERHLLAELIDHLGREEANALMDQLSAALAAETTAESTPVAPLFRPKTTQPPPEMKSHVPTLRPSLSPASDLQRPPAVNRRSVLLIDADRAARARVARALENVGCQVVVRDSCAEVASTVQDFDVLVTDILGVALDELLTSFAQRPPPCAIIAWTDDVDTARALFGASGLHRVLILRRDARGEALVDAVCASLGDLKGVARG